MRQFVSAFFLFPLLVSYPMVAAEDFVRDDRGFVSGQGVAIFVPCRTGRDEAGPTILFLNGFSENGSDGLKQISNNFGIQVWDMQAHFPFIAVCPQCRTDGSWTRDSLDTKQALEILDDVIEECGGDPDRVFLTGVSSGGSGVWNLASAYPERFAGIIPLCGSTGIDAQALTHARMPVWGFCNSGDSQGLVDSFQQNRATLIRHGLSPLLTFYANQGHDCWNAGYRSNALFRWMLEQDRSRNRQQALFTYVSPETVLDEWELHAANMTTDGDEIVVANDHDVAQQQPHAPGFKSRARLISPVMPPEFEFHVDLWLPAQATRELVVLPAGVDAGEDDIVIVIEPSDTGSGGIRTGSDAWLTPLDPAAQYWLKTDDWNDVRLTVRDGQLSASINGWEAAQDIDFADTPDGYQIALVGPDDGSLSRWRFVRSRALRTDNQARGASAP